MPSKPRTHKPRKCSAKIARPSAAARGYDKAWQQRRNAFLRQNPLCSDCERQGVLTPAYHVDHKIAKAKGGTDDESNLQALCHSCHSRKTVRCDNGFGRRPG